MNNITRELASEILKNPHYWKPAKVAGKINGYKPKVEQIRKSILLAREEMFYDKVYYPHLARLMETAKRWNLFPCVQQWTQAEMGYYESTLVWWPKWPDLYYELVDIIGDHMQYYLERIWNSYEWEYFEPDEGDLLALGILPDELVVQPKLF